MNLFRSLNEDGQTILMVTHNIDNRKYFDRVVSLRDGSLEEDIVPSSLQAVAAG